MAFLAMNAHLVLLQALVESFFTLPISATPMSLAAPLEMVRWGGRIFSPACRSACRSSPPCWSPTSRWRS
jgi:flagellar biosynthetic protein FliR